MSSEPRVGEDPFQLAFVAHRDRIPTIGQLVDAFAASGDHRLIPDAGLEYVNRIDGSWPEDLPGGFRVDSTDPDCPYVIAYVPESGSGDRSEPAFERFDDDLDEWSDEEEEDDESTAGTLFLHIRADHDVVVRAIERIAPITERLGLLVADHLRGDCIPADRMTLLEQWQMVLHGMMDRSARDPGDGSVAADRVEGIEQVSIIPDADGLIGSVDVTSDGRAVWLDSLGLHLGDTVVSLPTDVNWGDVRTTTEDGAVIFGTSSDDMAWYLWVKADGSYATAVSSNVAPGTPDVATSRHAAFGFGDESIFSGDEIEENGLVAIGSDGYVSFLYQRDMDEPVDISDCYALVGVEGSTIAMYAYTEFDVVVVDLDTRTQSVHPTPEPRGFHALTMRGDDVWFQGQYEDSNGIYRWRIGSDAMERVGTFPGLLRGIPGGRFVATGTRGCTIVTPTA